MYDMKALYEAKSVGDAVRLLQEHPQGADHCRWAVTCSFR